MASAAYDQHDTPAPRGYRAVWRWHFFAALWSAPVLLILTLTGAIYLFDREFDAWWNRDMQSVRAQGEMLPLAQQEAAVRAAHPGATVRRVRLPHHAGEASVWHVNDPDGTGRDIYVDPYRARVTGEADPARQPMNIVRDLHGTLMAGEVGSHVVELVACWTLVMMATGIWLWWPRRWKLRGVVVPRVAAGGRRRWRDLHAIPSVFNAMFVILLVLTGLPWSAFWGAQFARIGEVVPFVAASPNFKAPPKREGAPERDAHAQHRQHKAAPPDPDRAKIPWAIQHSPQPTGSGAGGVGISDIEPLLARLDMDRHGGGVRIFYPWDARGVFIISYVPDKAEGQRTIHIDPGTGRIMGDIGWRDYSPVAKAVEWGVMTHMGRQYGLVNQVVCLISCLVLVGSVVAGLILWWRRRPPGTLGAPTCARGEKMPAGIRGMIVALAILFPLVALSMVPVLLWGWCARRIGVSA